MGTILWDTVWPEFSSGAIRESHISHMGDLSKGGYFIRFYDTYKILIFFKR